MLYTRTHHGTYPGISIRLNVNGVDLYSHTYTTGTDDIDHTINTVIPVESGKIYDIIVYGNNATTGYETEVRTLNNYLRHGVDRSFTFVDVI